MKKESEQHPHVTAERAELFLSHDGGSTEIEYLALLAGFIRATKPMAVLETGSWNGHGTIALAEAVKANGFGRVITIEQDAGKLEASAKAVSDAGLTEWVQVEPGNTIEVLRHLRHHRFGVALFDTELEIRVTEFRLCVELGLMRSGDIAAFHDTSRLRTWGGQPDQRVGRFWNDFEQVRHRFSAVMELPLSRGMVIGKVA